MDELTEAIQALEHGERRFYEAGCRCDDCARANGREQMAQWRREGTARRVDAVLLEALAPPGDWMGSARCKKAPTSLFFPERGDDVRPAKQICAGCPVLEQCRAYALAAPLELQGVWGGLSQKERRESRRYGQVA